MIRPFTYLVNLLWILSSLVPYFALFVLHIWEKGSVSGIQMGLVLVGLISFSTVFTCLILRLHKKLSSSNETVKIASVRPAESIYLPIYVSYFVIALNFYSLYSLFVITVILIYCMNKTKIFYFNPILLIFGYNFYEVTTDKGVSLLIIIKISNIKDKKILERQRFIRLNEFVFMTQKDL